MHLIMLLDIHGLSHCQDNVVNCMVVILFCCKVLLKKFHNIHSYCHEVILKRLSFLVSYILLPKV